MSTLELFLNDEEDTIAFGKELACAIAIDPVPAKQAPELSGNSGLESHGRNYLSCGGSWRRENNINSRCHEGIWLRRRSEEPYLYNY